MKIQKSAIFGVAILMIGATTEVFAFAFNVNNSSIAAQNTTQQSQPQQQGLLQAIPQIPLLDLSYPNEIKTPLILSIINASESFMIVVSGFVIGFTIWVTDPYYSPGCTEQKCHWRVGELMRDRIATAIHYMSRACSK